MPRLSKKQRQKARLRAKRDDRAACDQSPESPAHDAQDAKNTQEAEDVQAWTTKQRCTELFARNPAVMALGIITEKELDSQFLSQLVRDPWYNTEEILAGLPCGWQRNYHLAKALLDADFNHIDNILPCIESLVDRHCESDDHDKALVELMCEFTAKKPSVLTRVSYLQFNAAFVGKAALLNWRVLEFAEIDMKQPAWRVIVLRCMLADPSVALLPSVSKRSKMYGQMLQRLTPADVQMLLDVSDERATGMSAD